MLERVISSSRVQLNIILLWKLWSRSKLLRRWYINNSALKALKSTNASYWTTSNCWSMTCVRRLLHIECRISLDVEISITITLLRSPVSMIWMIRRKRKIVVSYWLIKEGTLLRRISMRNIRESKLICPSFKSLIGVISRWANCSMKQIIFLSWLIFLFSFINLLRFTG